MPDQKSRSITVFVCLGLALAVLTTFAGALNCAFVEYDDPSYITNNPNIQNGITVESLKWAFSTGHAANWHPLTWISHMIDFQLYGLKPMGHHLTNLLFHAANSVLMFLLLRRITNRLWPSAFVAAIFALHPLRVESVVWVSERKDVLSTFFWILTVACYARYVQTPAQRTKWFALSLGAFAFALMSKPMVVTLPFVLMLLDFWPFRRFTVADLGTVWKALLNKAPFLFLALVSSVVTYLVQRDGGAVSSVETVTVPQRIENMFVSYVRYIGKTLWPSHLSILYPHPAQWPWWLIILSFVVVAGITVLVIKQIKARPYLVVGWFWFVGMLVPVIGLVQVGMQSMADRYTYVSIVGLLIAITWAATEVTQNRSVLVAVAAIAILPCCAITPIQVRYWHDSERLFMRAVEVTSGNFLAYHKCGYYLFNKGETERAMEFYKKAIEIKPNYEDAHNNLGFCLASQGKYWEAIEEYKKALGIKRDLTEAHNNLGNALSNVGELDAAIHEYSIAIEEDPKHADAHSNLGIALAMKGRLDEAIEHFQLAIRCKEKNTSAHSNLGNAYAVQGNNLLASGKATEAPQKFQQAISEYQECLRFNPNDSQSHNNLGNVLAQLNKMDEAIAEYRKAIQLKNENPEAHFNLGFALARLGKSAEAESEYRTALKQKPDYREAAIQLQALRGSTR